MARIFNTLSILTALMFLITGGGAYWFFQSSINQANFKATDAQAQGIALSISSHINTLQDTIDKMALSPDIITVIESKESLKMAQTATMLKHFMPGAINFQVLPTIKGKLDQSSIPTMGNADLIMIQESITFNKNQPPIIQGLGEDRHLAIISVVRKNNNVIGVVFAHLTFNFLQETLNKFQASNNLIELKQNNASLGVKGDLSTKNKADHTLKISGTPWVIHYGYSEIMNLTTLLYFASIVALSILLIYLACFSSQRKLQGFLKKDFNNITSIIKDLASEKNIGSYPMFFNEMEDVASKVVQLKHDLTRNKAIKPSSLSKTVTTATKKQTDNNDYMDTSAFGFD
jgi:phosphomannomutase/phosphoglucomutase